MNNKSDIWFDLWIGKELNSLSPEQEQQFQKLLLSDDSFRNGFESFIASGKLIDINEELEIRTIISDIEKNANGGKKIWLYSFLILSVSLLGIGVWNWPHGEIAKNEALVLDKKINEVTVDVVRNIDSQHVVVDQNHLNVFEQKSIEYKSEKQIDIVNTTVLGDSVLKSIDKIDTDKRVVSHTIDNAVDNSIVDTLEKSNLGNDIICALSFNVKATNTCVEERKGKLEIGDIKKATYPITISVNGQDRVLKSAKYLPFVSMYLSIGVYEVSVTDANGCLASPQSVIIKAKENCVVKKDFVLDFNRSTILAMTFDSSNNSSIEVYAPNGSLVIKKEIDRDQLDLDFISFQHQTFPAMCTYVVKDGGEVVVQSGTISLLK